MTSRNLFADEMKNRVQVSLYEVKTFARLPRGARRVFRCAPACDRKDSSPVIPPRFQPPDSA